MKKHFIKLLALGMTAAMVLSFAACGSDAGLEDSSTTGETQGNTETVMEPVTDENGNIVLDENGEPVTELITYETVEVPVLDEQGNPVLDENGRPKTEQQKKPVSPGNSGGQQGGSSGNNAGDGNNRPAGGNENSGGSGNAGNSGGNSGNTPGGNTGGNSGNQGGQQEPPKEEPQPDPAPERTWEYLEAESRAAFDAMNEFRKQNGIAPLIWRQDCQDAANKQAEWCAENSALDHGLSEIGQGSWTADPDVLIQRWADSPGHRESMLDTWNKYGAVSIYRDSNNYYYVIAHFEMEGDWEIIG